MSKHTPGPWASNKSESFGNTVFYVSQQDGAPYTQQYSDVASTIPGELESIQEANANLIAAAPEMLALLRRLKIEGEMYNNEFGDPSSGEYEAAFVEIDEVIAKAEGESDD